MVPQESAPTEYAPEVAAPPGTAAPLAKQVGWSLLGSVIGRVLVVAVCRQMSRNLERRRGAPVIESRRGAVRL
jgi:hypothetical protein